MRKPYPAVDQSVISELDAIAPEAPWGWQPHGGVRRMSALARVIRRCAQSSNRVASTVRWISQKKGLFLTIALTATAWLLYAGLVSGMSDLELNLVAPELALGIALSCAGILGFIAAFVRNDSGALWPALGVLSMFACIQGSARVIEAFEIADAVPALERAIETGRVAAVDREHVRMVLGEGDLRAEVSLPTSLVVREPGRILGR